MIVQRATITVKVGRMSEAAALVLEEGRRHPPRAYRVYTPHTGRHDALAIEWEFEDVAERERYWAEWASKPATPAFWEEWNELVEPGAVSEVWVLAE